MIEPDFPHFADPPRIANGRYVLVDQDSDDEILACAQRCVETPLGFATDEPGFGLREQALRRGGADLDEIAAALEDWEPRITERVEHDPQMLAQLVDRVSVSVQPIEEGATA